jgi:hypothetical protein
VQVHFEVRRAEERFGEVDGVVDDADQRERVAVADPVLGECCAVAAGDAVAADPADFEVRGGDYENVALPFARRETLPGMWRVGAGMWPSVHPDSALRSLPGDVGVPGDDLLRGGVDFLPDAEVGRAARAVVGRVRLALMFRQRQQGGVPGISAHAGFGGDGQAQVVADFGAGDALRLVFVEARGPLASEVKLGEGRGGSQAGDSEQSHRCILYRHGAPVAQ